MFDCLNVGQHSSFTNGVSHLLPMLQLNYINYTEQDTAKLRFRGFFGMLLYPNNYKLVKTHDPTYCKPSLPTVCRVQVACRI